MKNLGAVDQVDHLPKSSYIHQLSPEAQKAYHEVMNAKAAMTRSEFNEWLDKRHIERHGYPPPSAGDHSDEE